MSVLADTPEQMMGTLDEFEKIDCTKMIESASMQCRNRCASIKSKQDRKGCINSCDQTLGNLAESCKKMSKNIKDFRAKSKDEQKKILQEASEADRNHHH